MKNKELIAKLLDYNMDAEIKVIAHCKEEDFTLSYGGAEGETKKDCESVNIYVDRLCTNEKMDDEPSPVSDKDQKIIYNKLDELLRLRASKKDSLNQINDVIKQGIEEADGLPERWYVRNPKKSVIDYLETKYDKKLSHHKVMSVGYGELYNEFAFVPHDIDYSWEITQDEFDYAIKKRWLDIGENYVII